MNDDEVIPVRLEEQILNMVVWMPWPGDVSVLESRFVIAQLLAADGYPDEALAELQAVRSLLAEAFGPDSTQVRNLDRQAARLRAQR